jgi:hypothetical protein
MENKIYLPNTNGYYRIGSKVFNSRNQELIPDQSGRYKISVYRGKYFTYRPPGKINKPERIDTSNLKAIPGFSNYFYDSDKNVYSRTGIKLKPDNNYYKLKNDNSNYKKININNLI